MNRTYAVAAVCAAAVLAAACGSDPIPADKLAPVESRAGTPAASLRGADGTPQSQVATVDLSRGGTSGALAAGGATGAGAAALLAAPNMRMVYFDFDSFAIRDEFKPLIEAHARVLAANRGKRLLVEGHTDERGGREYNLALGQKRAGAVVNALTLLGATDAQLEAVSFGEERPAAAGSDEAAWAKNRRAELKDR